MRTAVQAYDDCPMSPDESPVYPLTGTELLRFVARGRGSAGVLDVSRRDGRATSGLGEREADRGIRLHTPRRRPAALHC
jgi:hypothetical protein